MSHLGQTADLAGAGFHNTSLSRQKDEMTKKDLLKINWKKTKGFIVPHFDPTQTLATYLVRPKIEAVKRHNPLIRIEVENAQFCTFPIFPKAEVVIHQCQWTTTPSQVPQSTCSCQHSVMRSKTSTKTLLDQIISSETQYSDIFSYRNFSSSCQVLGLFFRFTHIFFGKVTRPKGHTLLVGPGTVLPPLSQFARQRWRRVWSSV